MLYAISFYRSCSTSKLKPTNSSAERGVVLVISPFVSLMIGQAAHWAAEVINMRTALLYNRGVAVGMATI